MSFDQQVAATDSDLALLNSGTLRSDRIHPPGPFTLRDLNAILPTPNSLIVVQITGYFLMPFNQSMNRTNSINQLILMILPSTGEDILAALENGVSMYPKLEGRFLQVSGVSFAFDPNRPAGQRVDPRFVRIRDQYLELHSKYYRMVTKAYLCAGKDGYDVLKKVKPLVSEGLL